jgi:hypothetical protein
MKTIVSTTGALAALLLLPSLAHAGGGVPTFPGRPAPIPMVTSPTAKTATIKVTPGMRVTAPAAMAEPAATLTATPGHEYLVWIRAENNNNGYGQGDELSVFVPLTDVSWSEF